MQLVLGLGNPGVRYAATRHNVGFRCLEEAARRLGLGFTVHEPEYRAAVGRGPAGPLTLLQPLTYMNRSGDAADAWSRRTGWGLRGAQDQAAGEADDEAPPPANARAVVPIVVCDDIQLPLGSLRIRAGGSDGGQKGLASVIEAVGSPAVPRLRLGVGPRAGAVDPADWADYVLEPFAEDELPRADDLVDRGAAALLDLLDAGPERAASRHNRRIRPTTDLPDGG